MAVLGAVKVSKINTLPLLFIVAKTETADSINDVKNFFCCVGVYVTF